MEGGSNEWINEWIRDRSFSCISYCDHHFAYCDRAEDRENDICPARGLPKSDESLFGIASTGEMKKIGGWWFAPIAFFIVLEIAERRV